MRRLCSWAVTVGVFVAFLWPRYLYFGVGGKGIGAYPLSVVALLALALVMFVGVPAWQSRTLTGLGRASLPLIAFFAYYGWRLLADTLGVAPDSSVGLWQQEFVFAGGWLAIASVLFTDDRVRRRLPILIALCAILAALLGAVEYLQQRALIDVFQLANVAAIDSVSLDNIRLGSSQPGQYRIKSVFNHPIVFGQVMAMTAPFALHLVMNGRMASRLLGAVQIGAVSFALIACQSRSPMFVLVTAVAVYFACFWLDIRRRDRLLLLFVCVCAAIFVAPVLIESGGRIAAGETARDIASTDVRRVQLQRGQVALRSRPVFGYGSGQATRYAGVVNEVRHVGTIDTYYLSVAVEAGYVGLALLIAMLGMFLLFGVVVTVGTADSWERGSLAALTGLVAGVVPGFSVLSIPDALPFAYLAVGTMIASRGAAIVDRRVI